jgi:hypothetical protein
VKKGVLTVRDDEVSRVVKGWLPRVVGTRAGRRGEVTLRTETEFVGNHP